jgi:serine/threonine protein kinase
MRTGEAPPREPDEDSPEKEPWARANDDTGKGMNKHIGMGEGVTIGGRYRLGKEIGRGAFGNVFHALDLTSGSTVAVKRVGLGGMGRQELEGLQSELLLLQTLRHRNIVRCASRLGVLLSLSVNVARVIIDSHLSAYR